MFKSHRSIKALYICIDVALIFISFFLPYFVRFNYTFFSSPALWKIQFPSLKEYLFVFVIWSILLVQAFYRRNLYSTDPRLTIPQETLDVLKAVLSVSLYMTAFIFLAKFAFFSRMVFGSGIILSFITLTSWRIMKRIMLRYLIRKDSHNINVLIIGENKEAEELIEEIKRKPHLGLKVIGILDKAKIENKVNGVKVLGDISQFEEVCKKYFIDEVFITTSSQKLISDIMRKARNLRIAVRVVPIGFKDALVRIEIHKLGMVPLLTYKEKEIHPAELVGKRIFDITISLTLLILLSPFFLIIALLIKLDSPGPVFFVQKRMGRKGRIFNFYKFRTMVKDAEKLKPLLRDKNEVKGGVIFKIKDDPRVTRIGRFLRKYSLDELPQLVNVLKGDMSLVGPRPFLVEESQKIEYKFLSRLDIRPGITGMAQVRGRSDLSFYRWVKWDLWYVNNWSFLLDLKILWWTISAVLKRKGAY